MTQQTDATKGVLAADGVLTRRWQLGAEYKGINSLRLETGEIVSAFNPVIAKHLVTLHNAWLEREQKERAVMNDRFRRFLR